MFSDYKWVIAQLFLAAFNATMWIITRQPVNFVGTLIILLMTIPTWYLARRAMFYRQKMEEIESRITAIREQTNQLLGRNNR